MKKLIAILSLGAVLTSCDLSGYQVKFSSVSNPRAFNHILKLGHYSIWHPSSYRMVRSIWCKVAGFFRRVYMRLRNVYYGFFVHLIYRGSR